jgi:hypothetical protein
VDFYFTVLGDASLELVSLYTRPVSGGSAVPNPSLAPWNTLPAIQVGPRVPPLGVKWRAQGYNGGPRGTMAGPGVKWRAQG